MPAAEDDKDNDPEISMRALKGGNSQSTMRSFGQINDKQVVVLIDTGSLHNFISSEVALPEPNSLCEKDK